MGKEPFDFAVAPNAPDGDSGDDHDADTSRVENEWEEDVVDVAAVVANIHLAGLPKLRSEKCLTGHEKGVVSSVPIAHIRGTTHVASYRPDVTLVRSDAGEAALLSHVGAVMTIKRCGPSKPPHQQETYR